MFIGFIGQKINQRNKRVRIAPGFELWNLAKITLAELSKILQKIFPPYNTRILNNYALGSKGGNDIGMGISLDEYKNCSWGLLVPDVDGDLSIREQLFLLNIYSPYFLTPYFYGNRMGINRYPQNKERGFAPINFDLDKNIRIFKNKKFPKFYNLMIEESKYSHWRADRSAGWDLEDWRIFVACMLYLGLEPYENSKQSFTWQRESTDMCMLLEALFTAEDDDKSEVGYKLRKRVSALINFKFPDIEDDIKKLYSDRSSFVHGSFFKTIKKTGKVNNGFFTLPTPEFEKLKKQKERVRYSLIGYLSLFKFFKKHKSKLSGCKTVIEILEPTIIDINFRKTLNKNTRKIFNLLPKSEY